MWNSVLMDGVKWSFDRSSPPLTDDSHPDFGLEETQFRGWNFESHQQTNYSDWTNRLHPGEEEEDAEDLYVRHDPLDCSRRNYPSAAELFRNFVGKLLSNVFPPFSPPLHLCTDITCPVNDYFFGSFLCVFPPFLRMISPSLITSAAKLNANQP